MAVAIAGTPALVTGGGNYTAEAGSDRVVVFCVAREPASSGGLALSTLTWGSLGIGTGIAFNNAAQTSGARVRAVIAYVLEADIPSGAQALDATWSVGLSGSVNLFTAYTLTGVDQATPVDNTASAVADSGSAVDPLSGTIDVVDGTVQILSAGLNNSQTSTPLGGFTEYRDTGDTDYRAISHALVSALAGTVTFGLDFATAQSGAVMVTSFKPAASGLASYPQYQHRRSTLITM